MNTRGERTQIAVLVLVLVLAFGLRLYRLTDASIWYDEGFSIAMARESLEGMLRWTASDVHPPLYFAALHIWRLLAGESEFSLRFLSVVAGTLTVAALWKLGRWAVPDQPWVVVGAAALLATSRFAVWWSQEVRMYALAGLLCVLSLLFTVQLARGHNWRLAAGYIATTVAALWTLYLTVFLLVVEGLFWLWSLRQRPTVRSRLQSLGRWVILQVPLLLAFGAWLWYSLPRMHSWSAQQPFEPAVFVQLYATLLSLGVSRNIDDVRVPVMLVMALVATGVVSLIRRRSPGSADGLVVIALALAVPPVAVWGVTMLPRDFGHVPRLEARYLFPYAPVFYLLAAWSLSALAAVAGKLRGTLASTLVVGFLLLQGWSLGDYYDGRYLADDYKSLGATLRAHVRSGDAVLLHTDGAVAYGY